MRLLATHIFITMCVGLVITVSAASADTRSLCRLAHCHIQRPAPDPVRTIVIDIKHIDAADIALLFGGRFIRGRTTVRYRNYSGRYSPLDSRRIGYYVPRRIRRR